MTDRKKLEKYLIIGVIALFVVISATYAFFQAQLGDGAQTDVDIGSNTTDSLTFDVNNAINLNINQFNFGVGAGNLASSATATAILLANNSSNTATYTYYVYFKINSNEFTYTTSDSKPEIILTVTDPTGQPVTSIDGLTYVQNVQTTTSDGSTQTVSGFDITTATGTFAVASAYSITANSTTPTTQNWEFTATFINLDSDQQGNTGKTMDADIIIQEDEMKTTLADYITGLYITDGENGLYYHDGQGTYTNADQEAGDNSYRYSGADPDNYVCFGSDAASCPYDNLYRIIGVFDEDSDGEYNVKLIKADYTTSEMLGTDGRDYYGSYSYDTSYYKGSMDTSTIAAYRWNYDTSVSTYGSNDWTTSELNTVNLNTNYLNNIGSTWSNLIATTTWKVGGTTGYIYSVTVKNAYSNEIENPAEDTSYQAKIGLMYVSDYGYAASPENWQTTLLNYKNDTNRNNNWMYMGLSEWSITPTSSDSFGVNGVSNIGNPYPYTANSGYSARPVFYLNSIVESDGGSGTKSDPYRLAV